MPARDRTTSSSTGGGFSGGAFVSDASQYIGTPYVWGGSSPRGFDCSGLVNYTLAGMGVPNVPRTSEQQYAWAQPIMPSQLRPGDLVFLNFPGEQAPGHVMIWAGGGKVIQAPSAGQNVQRSSFHPGPIGSSEWGGTIVGYGRVPGMNGASSRPRQAASSGQGGGLLGSLEGVGSSIAGAGSWFVGGVEKTAGSAWGDVTGAISGTVDFFKLAAWLVDPVTWLRFVEGFFGFVLVVAGLVMLPGRSSSSTSPAAAIADMPGVGAASKIAKAAGRAAATKGKGKAAAKRGGRMPGSQAKTASVEELAAAA